MKTTLKFVSVRRVLLSSLVMVIVLLLGRPVYAGIINFSFDGVIGVAGTVTGTIYGLLDDGAGQAATSITIDSAHSPKKATLMSVFLPGLGQIYNDK